MFLLIGKYDHLKFENNHILDCITSFQDDVHKNLRKLKTLKNKSAYCNYCRQIRLHCIQINKFEQYMKINPDLLQPSFSNFLKWRQIVFCANQKCIKYKTEKIIDLKLCKQCKTKYYCSRKCQKYDWNHLHRTQCKKLKNILFS